MSFANGINQYRQVGAQSARYADPHELVRMLLDGALARVAEAQAALAAGDVPRRGERISRAIAILDGLRGSLSFENGAQLAANLDALYDYMQRTLLSANLQSDGARMEEVVDLLREIREAWMAIPQEARQLHVQNANGTVG